MSFLLMLKEELRKESRINFETEQIIKNDSEVITILRKSI